MVTAILVPAWIVVGSVRRTLFVAISSDLEIPWTSKRMHERKRMGGVRGVQRDEIFSVSEASAFWLHEAATRCSERTCISRSTSVPVTATHCPT